MFLPRTLTSTTKHPTINTVKGVIYETTRRYVLGRGQEETLDVSEEKAEVEEEENVTEEEEEVVRESEEAEDVEEEDVEEEEEEEAA